MPNQIRYSLHTNKKSQVATHQQNSLTRNNDSHQNTGNLNAAGGYTEGGGVRQASNDMKQNNFIPSSNLSQFLLKKGSNGSLHTFENEYNYKINLNNLNNNQQQSNTQSQAQQKTMVKKAGAKKNNLFKEVIVEDEAEDIRGSQMGAQSDLNQIGYSNANSTLYKKLGNNH